MADHSSSASAARDTTSRLFGNTAQLLEALADRVRRLQATVSNQTFPADVRVERRFDDEGQLYIDVVRVSTGVRQTIAGPL